MLSAMTPKTVGTRRSFIAIAGAVLSAPAAAAASWLPPSGGRDQSRLAHLEDVNDIRGLNQAYLQHAAAGAHTEVAALFADPRNAALLQDVSGLSPVDFGEHDEIEVAVDRLSASARVHVIVHRDTLLDPDCTLVEMAQAQGEGVVRASAPAVLEHTYTRRAGVWKILHSTHRVTTV
jgi:hypothetical protein